MAYDVARDVLRTESEAIAALIDRLDERFDRAVELILKGTGGSASGRVVVSGMGKSGLIGKKIAATLASTGTPAYFLHPAEAVHGDLGILVAGDIVLPLSHSGETAEVLRLVELVERLDLRSVAFVGQPDSTLARVATVSLDCSVAREACPMNLAPTASTAAALAMGDALALTLADRRGFTSADFARRHPGGQLGRRLLTVQDLMSVGDAVPRVVESATVAAAIREMTAKGFGITTVTTPDGLLVGVLTDGDLRRLLARTPAGLMEQSVERLCTRQPKTIAATVPAAKALAIMEEMKLTSLVVTDRAGRVAGILHLHHLWRLEIF